MIKKYFYAAALLSMVFLGSCGGDDNHGGQESGDGNQETPGGNKPGADDPDDDDTGSVTLLPKYEPTVPYLDAQWMTWPFAKGADVSYVTQMEDEGFKFHYIDGDEGDLFEILKTDCGVNATRFRVWVNPEPMNSSTGVIYNDVADVVSKAVRASNAGMEVMIDFHFSDYWADPSKQWMPADWVGKSVDELKAAIEEHVGSTLEALKSAGVTPRWVQIGNETSWGMLWDPSYGTNSQQNSSVSGQPHGDNFNTPQHANFAGYIQAGVNAVKNFDSDICTIVHVDKAQNEYPAKWIYEILKYYDVTYDMIGLSLYPMQDNAFNEDTFMSSIVDVAISNAESLSSTYGRPVIFAEVGMSFDYPELAADMIQQIMNAANNNSAIRGIFYWEPEANPFWEAEGDGKGGYRDGAFDPDTNSPTQALSPFLEND